jgi:cardiolipin synthase
VQLLLPGPNADKRFVQLAGEACYPALLEHGVEIWNFQPSMMHAKIMLIDSVVANIGSANLNSRSTACDEEINVVALDAELVRVLDEQFDDDLGRSVRIEELRWEQRNPWQRVGERLVAPLRRWS